MPCLTCAGWISRRVARKDTGTVGFSADIGFIVDGQNWRVRPRGTEEYCQKNEEQAHRIWAPRGPIDEDEYEVCVCLRLCVCVCVCHVCVCVCMCV